MRMRVGALRGSKRRCVQALRSACIGPYKRRLSHAESAIEELLAGTFCTLCFACASLAKCLIVTRQPLSGGAGAFNWVANAAAYSIGGPYLRIFFSGDPGPPQKLISREQMSSRRRSSLQRPLSTSAEPSWCGTSPLAALLADMIPHVEDAHSC